MVIHGFRNQQNVPAKNYNCNAKHQDTKGDYNNIKEQHPSPLIVLATLARPPQAISPYANGVFGQWLLQGRRGELSYQQVWRYRVFPRHLLHEEGDARAGPGNLHSAISGVSA
jgi:hypothetical protein